MYGGQGMSLITPQGADPLHGEVIARAKRGDRDALHFLYVRYAEGVHSCIRRIVHDRHEAEDLTQAVFVKLIRVIHTYEDRGLPFAAWINRVARNTALDHLRASRMVPCEEVRQAETETTNEAADYERLWSLREALEELPATQREVLVLRHIAGLSPSEIAERLGKSEGSVHGLHHRARGALRSALLERGTGPVTSSA
jgi:RNA polymerase sigma-70 factor (ECF subfamily)